MLAIAPLSAVYGSDDTPVRVSIHPHLFRANYPNSPSTKQVRLLMREESRLRAEEWGGIRLDGSAGMAPLIMAIAGRTAPDVMMAHFHVIRNNIRQGFLYPLNEWIGDDLNGNGQIDDDEAKWDRWKTIPPLWRHVATVDGKVYGIPMANTYYMGVVFRTDLVLSAGLDPEKPPETWDELIYWCQKLTDPGKVVPGAVLQRGQRGIGLVPYGFTWLPWVQSAGGSPIVQTRTSPTTGKEYSFAMEATNFVTPEGEDLSGVEPKWQAGFTSEEALAATNLYHKLRWMKWMFDPETGKPVDLSEKEIAAGEVVVDGRTLPVDAENVITGVARGQSTNRNENALEMLARGEVAMVTWFVQDMSGFEQSLGIDPDLLSWFPFPAGPRPKGRRVVQKQNHYAALCEAVGLRSKEERDLIWKVLTTVTNKAVTDDEIRSKILAGLARFVNPQDLERLGFDDYLRDVSPTIRANFAGIDGGEIGTFTEPFMGFWWPMDRSLNQEVLSLVIAEAGADFDYAVALAAVEEKANSGVMFGRTKEELDRYRPTARILFGVVAAIMLGFIALIVRSFLKKSEASTKQVYRGWLPWALAGPALLLIGLWSYYPLLRGMVMAFQDYRISGESASVGLDNFITLGLDASWWASLGRTVYFVFLNMTLAFTAPIILALLLSEVPRGKIFYRTLFFLPQITSGLVIALLWKLMYDPTPIGFLNQVIALLNRIPYVEISTQTWLQDPQLAMICCVIPTVWASMGMASLIYLAALHSIPNDLYEAADIDGAGVWTKIRAIAFPTILPLIIINFVGTFISTFQNMGNIFLLTFGGPGETTMVAGMRIWIEAYANLRFSMATSMAWILGTMLIAFTYLQIRILRRVEFKKAEWS